MGVRDLQRTRQRISWSLYNLKAQGYGSQGGDLTRIDRLPQPRRLEITPYVVEKSQTRSRFNGGYYAPLTTAVAADLKMGIGSGLTVGATINADFSQVDADPSALNLTAFA